MPSFPAHVVASPVPDVDDITLVEAKCRLVGAHDHERTDCATGLTLPTIRLDLGAIDQAYQQNVPVIEVAATSSSGAPTPATAAAAASSSSSTAVEALKATARFLSVRLGFPSLLSLPDPQASSLISWHCNKQILAVGHASSGAVLLYDFSDVAGAAAVSNAEQVLTHQLQQQVSSVAWRPVNSSMLAAGCEGGVALWNLGRLPLAASNKSGRGGGPPAAGWVSFLPFKKSCRVSSLAWSPDGRLLAGSSIDCNRMTVWDVALGVGANLRLGLQPVTCLSWSPDGNYLFAAASTRQFYLYETTTWSLRSWDTPRGAAVTAAAWAPDSSVALLVMSNSSYLVALHLVGEAPKLIEQLLPIMLPGVSDIRPEDQPAETKAAPGIRSIAWDPTGSRLAVVLGKPHPAAGTIALYSTAYRPVVECNLIGYMQPGSADVAQSKPQKSLGDEDDSNDARADEGAISSSRSPHLAFARVASKAGAVLSIGMYGIDGSRGLQLVRNVPMYC